MVVVLLTEAGAVPARLSGVSAMPRSMIKSFVDMAMQMGMGREAAERLAKRILEIPSFETLAHSLSYVVAGDAGGSG